MDITQEYLKSVLHYDPDTGVFTWVAKIAKKICVGNIAGCVTGVGRYRYIKIHGQTFAEHRLAFLYMTGALPIDEVDHINHNRTDNRWDNLRDVDRKNNGRNHKVSKRNNSGVVGVHWDANRKKWSASITYDGRIIYLGRYSQIEDAAEARAKANVMYGFHVNHGVRV